MLGPFKVGDNSRIAANAVVLNEIPDHATAVGAPAKVVRVAGEKVELLDHTHIPDPIAQALKRLSERIDKIEKEE